MSDVTVTIPSTRNADGTETRFGANFVLNADGSIASFGSISSTGSPVATAAATTSVAAAVTPVSLLAADTNRAGASITNDSTAIMYALVGTGTASSTNYTFAVDGKTTVGGQIDLPSWAVPLAVTAVWASATGSARVTAGVR